VQRDQQDLASSAFILSTFSEEFSARGFPQRLDLGVQVEGNLSEGLMET
jgi:hypothetical protein